MSGIGCLLVCQSLTRAFPQGESNSYPFQQRDPGCHSRAESYADFFSLLLTLAGLLSLFAAGLASGLAAASSPAAGLSAAVAAATDAVESDAGELPRLSVL